MTTSQLEFTQLQNRLFRLLCIRAGEKLNQRELSRIIGATPTGIAKALKGLEDAGFAKIEKSTTMNLNHVSLDRSQKAMRLKQIENLKQVYETGLLDCLEELFPGTAIILFGSYARGEDTMKSDIDIAVVGTKEKRADLKRFEDTLQREIRISFFASFKDIRKELKENLLSGILLAGGLEL